MNRKKYFETPTPTNEEIKLEPVTFEEFIKGLAYFNADPCELLLPPDWNMLSVLRGRTEGEIDGK